MGWNPKHDLKPMWRDGYIDRQDSRDRSGLEFFSSISVEPGDSGSPVFSCEERGNVLTWIVVAANCRILKLLTAKGGTAEVRQELGVSRLLTTQAICQAINRTSL